MATAPISLYFDIAPDQAPDLEVIGRASIAWSKLLKEVAAVVDPSVELRVEFLSGTIGSRSINSVVRAVQKVAVEHPWTVGPLIAITGIFLTAPVSHVADHATETVFGWFGHQDTVTVDDESAERIAQKVAAIERDKIALELRREIYREAQSDPVVTGLGSTPIISSKPAIIVPRSQFTERTGPASEVIVETVERKEEWKRDYPVVIVRSYSKGEERRWRFEHGGHEFSATMRDPAFLDAIRSRHTGVEIGEGVEMRIDLRTRMEKVGGVWEEKALDVMRVVYPVPSRQMLLQLTPDQPNKPSE